MEFEKLATRYTGERASTYDAHRIEDPEWKTEHAIVDALLAELPAGATVADIPVGTGRFLELYKSHALKPLGFDISPDMLAQAGAKAKALGLEATLRLSDIRKIDTGDASVDGVVCIRFLNWLDIGGVDAAMSEIGRISRSIAIVSARIFPAPRSLPQSLRRSMSLAARRLRKPQITVHNEEEIEPLFARHGFSVAEKRLVLRRPNGSEFYIYLLRKSAA